jgi:hypothetical protein
MNYCCTTIVSRFKYIISGFTCLLVTVTVVFFSCKKEYSNEGGLISKKQCVKCSYLPVCDSSEFVYVDSSINGIDTVTSYVSIKGDTIISGKKFTKVSALSTFENGLLYNCENEDYKFLLSLADLGLNMDSIFKALQTTSLPVPIPPNLLNIPQQFQISLLKASLPVNASWTDTLYSFNIPFIANFFAGIQSKILEKNVQRVVFTKTYSNVIHVQSKLVTASNLITIPRAFSIDIFFAKDVGIIEMQVYNDQVLQLLNRLYSYKL